MREYPIVPDIHAEIKFWRGIFLKDVILIFLISGLGFMLSGQFPEGQHIQSMFFFGLSVLLAIYLDLRPYTNPGRRNYEVIWMMVMNLFEENSYKSLNYYEFRSVNEIEVLNNGDQVKK